MESVKPISPEDYLIDSSCNRTENNNLLDYEGSPNPELTELREISLANFASYIHKNSPALLPDQIELLIKWLKRMKLRNQHPRGSPFYVVMDKIKNSGSQKALETKAYRQTLWARFTGVLFAISGAITLSLIFVEGNMAWYWFVLAILVNLSLITLSDIQLQKAVLLYKEQEQKNLWECIRKAETVEELRDAGLFAYLPNSYPEAGKVFSEEEALKAMKAEQVRLTNALYTDPDNYLES